MSSVKTVKAREILDSRGNPTVEVGVNRKSRVVQRIEKEREKGFVERKIEENSMEHPFSREEYSVLPS
jgi:enolase